jgi:hypothetical protein
MKSGLLMGFDKQSAHGLPWRAGRVSVPVSPQQERAVRRDAVLRSLYHREAHASRSPACGIIRFGCQNTLRCFLLLVALAGMPPRALGGERTVWLTGSRLQQQRQQTISVVWRGVPIRKALGELAKLQHVAILLDRRIDPGCSMDLVTNDVTLDDLLMRSAEKLEGRVAWLGPLAYIGPRDAASRLRTLAALRTADVRALSKEKRMPFERAETWQWDILSEPRALLSNLAAKAQVDLDGLDLVPHDLWPAADLPALTWTDRFTLLANEFDLTFEFTEASHVRLLPVVAPVVIQRSYPGGKQAEELASRWKRLTPDAEIAIVAGKLVVRGRLEDHELLRSPKSPSPPASQ